MNSNIGQEYFDLLLKDSVEDMEEFLSQNGNIKADCPIMFIDNSDMDDNKEDKES